MLLKSPHNRILSRAKTPAVMGILNVGTESFSDGGKYASPEAAAARAAVCRVPCAGEKELALPRIGTAF